MLVHIDITVAQKAECMNGGAFTPKYYNAKLKLHGAE